MRRRPPRSTRPDTPFPYPALVRSLDAGQQRQQCVFDLCAADRQLRPDAIERWWGDGSGRQRQCQLSALCRSDQPAGIEYELRSEEHTSELQSLLRISYAVFCLTKQKQKIEL